MSRFRYLVRPAIVARTKTNNLVHRRTQQYSSIAENQSQYQRRKSFQVSSHSSSSNIRKRHTSWLSTLGYRPKPISASAAAAAVAAFHTTGNKMVKDTETVIQEFTELVNMDPDELEVWLETETSTSSGWTKSDGTGESVGHESGRKIVDILRRNPEKDPEAFEEDDIQHMRKVVSYCKRHLAQEEKAKQDTESRSYRSLKNWGHDALKE